MAGFKGGGGGGEPGQISTRIEDDKFLTMDENRGDMCPYKMGGR